MVSAPPSAQLAEAFHEFISASARLELSYRDLQAEVADLSLALSERNQALSASLSEKKSMRLALEQVLHSMPCGVLVVTGGGAIRLANAEAARLLRLSKEESTTPAVIAGQASVLTLLDAAECFAEDAPEQELCLDPHGPTQWVAVRQVRLSGGEGAFSQQDAEGEIVLTLRDISTRKRIEAEREEARDSVALAQVSALLAHEIRNPLASLELFAGLIADSPERRDEWLSHLRAGIRSLSGTVNNVLLLHGNGAPVTELLDVEREAGFAVEFLRPLSRQSGVALHLDVRGKGALWLQANKSALGQLLMNLCSNALRHTPPGGEVRVACSVYEANHDREDHEAPQNHEDRDTREIHIAVSDTGCGIAPAMLPRLFEGGFSGSGNTPGLGLAVCDRLMRQHGGRIRVQSQPGLGSTFTLEFPQA